MSVLRSSMIRRATMLPCAIAMCVMVASCHHDIAIITPDLAQSQLYQMSLANNQTPPLLVRTFPVGPGYRYLVGAQMMPVDLGRGTEPRVFDDRSGSGSNGSTSRDSSAASGRVSDVRIFDEVSGGVATRRRDSVVVNVIRRGDTLFVQRESISPALAYVDTGFFTEGKLLLKVRRWTSDASEPTTGTLIVPAVSILYSITR